MLLSKLKKKSFFLAVYFFCVTTLILASLEIGSSLLWQHRYRRDEIRLAYRYDPLLGWFPERNSHKKFKATKEISVRHNRRGFRDGERSSDKAKPRILFLGDSFVWGYDVEEADRFTEKLQERLKNSEVINLGVSAYSTDQELLLIRREWGYYKPELVFLMIGGNDRAGNSSNMAYGYYKPYFLMRGNQLAVQGIPVPKNVIHTLSSMNDFLNKSSLLMLVTKIYEKMRYGKNFTGHEIKTQDPTEYLVKEIDAFLKQRHSFFVVALIDSDERLERYCEKENILLLDLTSIGQDYRFPSNGQHWNEQGHRLASERIVNFIERKGLNFS